MTRSSEASVAALPGATSVLIAGGGPVGLAAAVELGRRGVECLVIEPRTSVSRARPRCKTVSVRSMEHLRRWGIADRLRDLAPLPVSWSQDIVFCTSLSGRELSRFEGVLGLTAEGDRFAELGQQAPQYVLEELLRDVVDELGASTLLTGLRVTGLEQDDHEVRVGIADAEGHEAVVSADYVLGCDGGRSTVRDAIGFAYSGEHALRPNFGMVFDAPELWEHVRHGPAVQYWIISEAAPSLIGPLDRNGTWWMVALGVDRETGERDARAIIDAAVGTPVDATVLSTDPWTARMQLVDRSRRGRVFLAGDAAHLNPPFGGHGLNTGIGDAVDLGWKLAATLDGWGGPELLDSYELERRPVQTRVIAEAATNMATLAGDLVAEGIDDDGDAGEDARRRVAERIQAAKKAEFHALDLVLDIDNDASPIVVADGMPLIGGRLPHAWLGQGRSIYDQLGEGLTLLVLEGDAGSLSSELVEAAEASSVPLRVVDLGVHGLRSRYGADLVLVRPDQHIGWRGDRIPADPARLIDRLRGAGQVRAQTGVGA